MTEPPIPDYSAISLRKPFARVRCEVDLGSIPQVYVNDFIGLVVVPAWEQYQKGDRGMPKPKRDKNPVNTIPSESFRGQCRFTTTKYRGEDIPAISLPGGILFAPRPDKKTGISPLEQRLLRPLRKLQEAMRTTPENFPKLCDRLAEGDRYQQVLTMLQSGDLPQVDHPLEKEIAYVRKQVEAKGEKAIGLVEKRLTRLTGEKYDRLFQVLELLKADDLPQPHPLKAEVRDALKLIEKGEDHAISTLQKRIGDRQLEASITHLATPGSFRLKREDKAYYLQISGDFLATATPSQSAVGIDVGTDCLYTTSTGVTVRHQEFGAQERRIELLQRILAKKQPGSSNFKKVKAKIARIEGEVKRSKRKHQAYHAAWQTDRHQKLAVRQLNLKEVVAKPVPIPDKEGEKYLPNGATDAAEENKLIQDKAIGQFVVLLEQSASAKGRELRKVECDPSATPSQILELAGFPSDRQSRTQAPKPSSDGAGEGQLPSRGGKATTPSDLTVPQSQAPELVSTANSPTPSKRPRRNRKREQAIG